MKHHESPSTSQGITTMRSSLHPSISRFLPLCTALLVGLTSAAVAQPGDPSQDQIQKAKDAYALLNNNQTRCLNLASRRLEAISQGPQAVERFAQDASAGELAVAFRSLRITHGLISTAAPSMPLAGKNLNEMQDSQVEVCTQSGSGSESFLTKVSFEYKVEEQNNKFNAAERKLSRIIPLSAAEMQEILGRYQDQLYGFGTNTRGLGSATGGDPIADRQISADEYAKKKEAYDDWRAEQERIEKLKLQREQERRDYLEEQQRQGIAQPAPKIDVKDEAKFRLKYQPQADQQQMVQWQTNFKAKLTPFRTALTDYLKLKHGTRKLLKDACWKFSEESRKLLEDPSVTQAPDPRMGPKVKAALGHFQKAGVACLRTSPDAAKPHMRRGEAGLGDIAELLRAYRLGL